MQTVNEVSKLTGVSVRTLQYYDKIGLLKPSGHTKSGYRLYDYTALEKLQQILLFRELEFPLKEIKKIMDSPDYDRSKALNQQIKLLTLKKEHIENLISLARSIKLTGGKVMDFSAFDTSKIEEYAKQAKETWGTTPEYKEFEVKNSGRSLSEINSLGNQLMSIIAEFGSLKTKPASDPSVQSQVKKLQDFITEHYYTCSNETLYSLGQMYAGGGEFTANIDRAGGIGTAKFTSDAISIYCGKV